MANKYTKQETEYLIANYANTDTRVLAKVLKRSIRSVYAKSNTLNLKKNKEFIAETARKNILNLEHGGRKTQFKKGNIPLNKGKNRTEYMSEEAIERCEATQFKKGNIPHNHKPVGYERVSVNGYIEIKVKEPNVFQFKHRHIYEQKHGVIPHGYNIIFMDGNKRNFDIKNLYCISDAELMNRNTIHQHPENLQKAIRLNNKLLKLTKDEKTN